MDLKTELAAAIAQALDGPASNAPAPNAQDAPANAPSQPYAAFLETPPNPDMGDFALPCFKFSPQFKKAPGLIAQELCAKIQPPAFIREMRPAGGYVNFFLDKEAYARQVLTSLPDTPEGYGRGTLGAGKTIVIDYSSPNTAKIFHVGHLYTTVIGNALYKIFTRLGYRCVGINHLGDWGTQFGQLLCAYKKWSGPQAVEAGGIGEMTRLYTKFHQEAEADPALGDEARAWFVKMQNQDPEALEVWRWFNDLSLREYNRVYDLLGVTFDYFTGESFYNDKMDAVVEELRAKNLLVESDGAMIVDLTPHNMPPCLILRRDGGTLYPTRDIAAAFYRKKTFDFDQCLIVTGMDQSLHFAQWFKVVELMGCPWANRLRHVPYGLVRLEEGKFSTRKGNAVPLEELLRESVAKTLEIINARNPALPEKERVARQVGIGAVIFNDLYNSRIKDVVFSWERVLNFEGETGPYVQYAQARARSVLAKAGEAAGAPSYAALTDPYSFEILRLLAGFGQKLEEAAEKYEPFVLTRHLVALAQAFSRFYHEHPILKSEGPTRAARLALTRATADALAAGLGLLGIEAPEEM